MFNVTKTLVINDLTNFPIDYTLGTTQATSTALLGDNLFIGGLLGYTSTGIPYTKVSRVVGTRAKAGTTHKVNVTAATASEITVTGTIPANTKVYLTFNVVDTHWEAMYQTKRLTNFRQRPFEINITTGETAATFLAKMVNTITYTYRARGVKNPNFTVAPVSGATVSGTYNDGTTFSGILASALTQPVRSYTSISDVDFETLTSYQYFEKFAVTGVDNQASAYVTVFAPTTTQVQAAGMGTYDELFAKRTLLGMDWANGWASQNKGEQAQIPIRGNLYTEFAITMTMDRKDFHNYFPNSTSDEETLVIWVNQTALETSISSLADYFDRSSGSEIWNAVVGGTYTNNVTLAQFKTNA
jgi:hypothetical protein